MRLKEKVVFLLFTYPIGVFLGIVFSIARALKIVRVVGKERIFRPSEALLVICNHPAILETFLIPFLFFKYFLFRPFRYAPYSVPDKRNFYDPWYFFWMRPVLISIEREAGFSLSASDRMRGALNSRRIIIFYPEGGRTFKGKEFSYSKTGKRVRKFQRGAAWLLRKYSPWVLPIWVEGTGKLMPGTRKKLFSLPCLRERAVIKIGEAVQLPDTCGENLLTRELTDLLLKTADQEG